MVIEKGFNHFDSNDYVKKVEIPVLYLSAYDDPLAKQFAIPR